MTSLIAASQRARCQSEPERHSTWKQWHVWHTANRSLPTRPHRRVPGVQMKAQPICGSLPCGADTYVEALPACPSDVLNRLAPGVDAVKDGCADPYNVDDKGLCSKYGDINKNSFSKLEQLERLCENPGCAPSQRWALLLSRYSSFRAARYSVARAVCAVL